MSAPPVPPEGGTPTHRRCSSIEAAPFYEVTHSFAVALIQLGLTECHSCLPLYALFPCGRALKTNTFILKGETPRHHPSLGQRPRN